MYFTLLILYLFFLSRLFSVDSHEVNAHCLTVTRIQVTNHNWANQQSTKKQQHIIKLLLKAIQNNNDQNGYRLWNKKIFPKSRW